MVDAFARYKIIDPLLFFQSLTDEAGAHARIDNVMDAAMRSVLGGTSFIDVVKEKREELMRQIAQRVNGEVKNFGIEIVDVRIKRADLPEANSQAIYERMKTEREREAAEIRAEGSEQSKRIKATADRGVTVIIADANRDSERLRGEGDAERNRIYAEAFSKDPDFFAFYRSMQAYEEGLKSNDTRLVISPNTEFFQYFNSPNGKMLRSAAAGAQRSGSGLADLVASDAMNDFLVGVGLVLVIEGLLWALAPALQLACWNLPRSRRSSSCALVARLPSRLACLLVWLVRT